MQIINFTTIPPHGTHALVGHLAEHSDELADARFGGDLPTRVLFPPEHGFPASLHYMFFPRGTCQRFHRHPGGRHLLVIGDTDLQIRSSTCGLEENPYVQPDSVTVAAHTLALIRFPAQRWHEFSAPAVEGTGVVAFSFHDTDDLISSAPNLMEELTSFWDGPNSEIVEAHT